MTDGEWWRKSGPWSERAAGGAADVPSVPEASSGPEVPPAPEQAPEQALDPDSVYDPPAPSTAGFPAVSLDLPDLAAVEERADAIPPPTVQSTGPWTMTLFDFSDGPQPAPKPIPEQRTAEEAEAAPVPVPEPEPVKKPRRGLFAPRPAPTAPPQAPAGKGAKGKARGKGKGGEKDAPARKPSPLILLSCALLVGGAATGFFPAMLAGWGLGYLSRQISDLMRKFVILGIPLVTMSATTLLSMQRAKQSGGQGGGLQSGSPLGQISWSAAPNVLRLSAVLSAVVLLLLALRRRPPQRG
ncbi:hypothetical protein [Kitasatospora brasiliensis]|uniref:hypothetical protein n=1 Tax=Kitasatospora brasiliensis TaxID=3058040 RepID=UPI002931AE90|nr:hypothetical protein [Kitasatospora sp. K002]